MMSSADDGQATPTPPLPTDSSDVINANFMADTEQEAKEERAAHAASDAEQQCRREAPTAEEESDDDGDFD
jgi:hypothetical protein